MRPRVVSVLGAVPVVLALAIGASETAAARGADEGRVPVVALVGRESGLLARQDGTAAEGLTWVLAGDGDVALSPDGRRVAFSSARDGNREIYVGDAASGALVRVTRSPGADDVDPAWSPSGARLAWASGATGRHDLWVARPDGTARRRVVARPADDVEPAWAPDGATLAFSSSAAGRSALWTVDLRAQREPEPLAELPGDARAPAWHPSGERLAFTGIVGGNADVWTVTADGSEPRRLVAGPAYEGRPSWSSDGRTLGFLRGRGVLAPWLARADGTGAAPFGVEAALELELGAAGGQLAPRPDALLPDLDQRAPARLVIRSERGRVLLGFASAVDSVGEGPLWIRGTRPPDRRVMRAHQLVALRGGGAVVRQGVGEMRFEAHPPHRHWHLEPFDRYELLRASDGALVREDRKTGFCLLDRWGTAPLPPDVRRGPPQFLGDCGAARPDARTVEEGSSVGYTDRYPEFFHGQEVDVTEVPAGLYVVVHRANPERRMRELSYANNVASVLVRLRRPGGVVQPPTVEVLRSCDRTDACRLR